MSNNGWSNQTGRRLVLVVGSVYSGIFFYDPTIGGGNLIMSIVPAAGQDPYGNVYAQGMTVGKAGGPQVVIGLTGGEPLIYFPTGNTGILNASALQTIVQGAGNAAYDQFQILGAQNSTQLDSVLSTWLASSTDGTQQPQIQDYYHDPAGVYHLYRLLSFAGCTIEAGAITAVDPTTGTARTNAAKAETWHAATGISALWTTTGTAQPARYRLMPDGTALLDGELITTGAGPWPANATMFSVPVGYRPTQSWPAITRSDIAVAAGQCTVNVLNSGGVQNGQAFTAAGQRLWFNNVRFPVT